MRYLWVSIEFTPDGEVVIEGERENGLMLCPRCRRWRPLIEDVTAYEPDTGRIVEWGPGQAVCCGLLLVDDWDRARALKLRSPGWYVKRVPALEHNALVYGREEEVA